MSGQEIQVYIGEVKVARRGEALKAILGSCVGIGIIWKERKICGLAHCLLAEAPEKTFSIGGRFVDQAVRSLVALMKIRPGDASALQVIVAGGGNMTRPGAGDPEALVGAQNIRVARRELREHGLSISLLDPAREEGRRVTLFSADGSYRIETIPRCGETGEEEEVS